MKRIPRFASSFTWIGTVASASVAAVVGMALLFSAGCNPGISETDKTTAAQGTFPKVFRSDIAAVQYMHRMPMGGHVESFKVRTKDVMVTFHHGPGSSISGIAIYRWSLWRWTLVSELVPPATEPLSVLVSETSLTLVGSRSKRTWPLLDLAQIK